MTTLREAAQALLDEIRDTLSHVHDDAVHDLVQALARPPEPDRWTEGAEAMREAVEKSLQPYREEFPLAASLMICEVRGLPVPPATTAPDSGCRAGLKDCINPACVKAREAALNATPEAKSAESAPKGERRWGVRYVNGGGTLATVEPTPMAAAAFIEEQHNPGAWEVVEICCITVEPAPVEPEETPR